jgi:hypothetical protein
MNRIRDPNTARGGALDSKRGSSDCDPDRNSKYEEGRSGFRRGSCARQSDDLNDGEASSNGLSKDRGTFGVRRAQLDKRKNAGVCYLQISPKKAPVAAKVSGLHALNPPKSRRIFGERYAHLHSLSRQICIEM